MGNGLRIAVKIILLILLIGSIILLVILYPTMGSDPASQIGIGFAAVLVLLCAGLLIMALVKWRGD